jgi:ring-1,2-phenylacetyl-CoA epoxidase subunit PaaD
VLNGKKMNSAHTVFSEKEIRDLISQIPDPEIPVITIEELGILRDINIVQDQVIVSITPTYSGCPAMKVIENEILSALKEHGIKGKVKLVFSPVWTTDWLSDSAKEKLRLYGIAPPEKTSTKLYDRIVKCPRCGSVETLLVSAFGSTACKAIYKCKSCLEPFDEFKCH